MPRQPHSRVRVDALDVDAAGICARCNKRFNLKDLMYQHIISGRGVVNTRVKVCERCYDDLNEQKRTITPIDDYSVRDSRPGASIAIDGVSALTLSAFPGYDVFRSVSGMFCELT